LTFERQGNPDSKSESFSVEATMANPVRLTVEQGADLAIGAELEAVELASQLEWAEAQGRDLDAVALRRQLEGALRHLADIAELMPAA